MCQQSNQVDAPIAQRDGPIRQPQLVGLPLARMTIQEISSTAPNLIFQSSVTLGGRLAFHMIQFEVAPFLPRDFMPRTLNSRSTIWWTRTQSSVTAARSA